MDSSDIRSGLYQDLRREHGFEPLKVEGALPPELAGTLYRNGPGLFGSHGRRYSHLFEGQGAVTAVRFVDGAALGASRVIEGAGLREERAAGRALYDSAAPRGRRIANRLRGRDKNTANVNVIAWQGRVFGLRDVAKPIELAPDTLATLGETDLDGAIVATFTAHPHLVAARGAIYGFGMRYGRRTRLDLYELPARGAARLLGSLPCDAHLVHDFAATERHLVFFLGPLRFHLPAALLGEARPERLVRWDARQPAEVIVVPIDEPERPVRFPAEPFYVWHFANAFERDGRIVVDFVRHDDATATRTFCDERARGGGLIELDCGELTRATLDKGARTLRCEKVVDAKCEFPRVDSRGEGSARRYVWVVSEGAGERSIVRCDLERATTARWVAPRGSQLSEPIFAPRPGTSGEIDGWVLVLVYDERAEASHVAVLDASAPERGPLARVHFDHPVPLTLHGSYVASRS
jgi:all-trans-8'-apo-beta-carotenal 15,15'-oxygenase